MAIEKVIQNTDEACKILKELVQTPQCYDLHFEFDIKAGEYICKEYKGI